MVALTTTKYYKLHSCPITVELSFICYPYRVLQRLADKSLLDGVTKYSKDKWESLIRNLLQKGGDDYAVYSLLREYYIGKNLEDSLKIQIPSLEEGRKCVLKNEHENDNEGEDGRANYMVEMTLECLPLSQDQKSKYTF